MRYPDFIAGAGLEGVIVEYEPEIIRVRMDEPLKGAEPWDNEVHWYWDDVQNFEGDVKILR